MKITLPEMEVRATTGATPEGQLTLVADTFVNETLYQMFKQDVVIASILDTIVDSVTFKGYKFTSSKRSLRVLDLIKEKFDNYYDFDVLLDNIIYSALIYGWAAVEHLFNGSSSKATELNILDGRLTDYKLDEHGNLLYLMQGTGRNKRKWSPDEVTIFTYRKVGNVFSGEGMLKVIYSDYTLMSHLKNMLNTVVASLLPKSFFILTGAGKEERREFIANLVQSRLNPQVDLVARVGTSGSIEYQQLQQSIDSSFFEALRLARQDVMMASRVPPIWLGVETGGSNRGNAEAQIYGFETKVKKIQQVIASQINRDLLKKAGYPADVKFVWNSTSLRSEKVIIQNAQMLEGLGLRGKDVLHYLTNNGVDIPQDAKITNPFKKSKDVMPSRQRMDKYGSDLKSDVQPTGVSDAGGNKLEQIKEKVV